VIGEREGLENQVSTTDPEELQERLEQRGDFTREERAEIRQQLSTVEGRAFVWRLMWEGGVFEDILGTAEQVYRALGRRSAALKLYARCVEHPDLYLQMQGEAVRRGRDRRRVRRSRTVNKPAA
jgi:hypothetical protein